MDRLSRTAAVTEYINGADIADLCRRYQCSKGILSRAVRCAGAQGERYHQRSLRAAEMGTVVADVVRNMTGFDIKSQSRAAPVVAARHAAMLVLRRRGFSTPDIAAALNRKDHSTVIHGLARCESTSTPKAAADAARRQKIAARIEAALAQRSEE